jgi:glycosyltransferase involved in cell wall biosynthesis
MATIDPKTEGARNGLAIVGGFVKPRESLAHGTAHAAYQICRALATLGRYPALHVYHEPARTPHHEAELSLPEQGDVAVFDKSLLRSTRERYQAIYVANGVHMSSAPHLLRPENDWAPVICSVGSAHNPGQWSHLLLALMAGAVRPSDGWIFKSQAARTVFHDLWNAWAARIPRLPRVPEATTVIANAVDPQLNQRSERLRAETRRLLRLSDDAVVFLAYSRLSPGTKGDQQALVVRWRDVVERCPTATLVLAGAVVERPFVADLRHLARAAGVGHRVLIVDNPTELSGDARLRLMSAADAFVHLSTGVEETSPLVVHEAMAHALPVIVADWGGMREVVEPGLTGFLLETRNAPLSPYLSPTLYGQSEIVHALAASRVVALAWGTLLTAVQALGDPATRARMAAAARSRATRRSLATMAEEYADYFAATCHRAAHASAPPPALRPLVDLDAIVSAQASHALAPEVLVRLADADRVALLEAGALADAPDRVGLVVAAFDGHQRLTLAELARALVPSDPERAYALCGRLLVRMLNFGVLALVE